MQPVRVRVTDAAGQSRFILAYIYNFADRYAVLVFEQVRPVKVPGIYSTVQCNYKYRIITRAFLYKEDEWSDQLVAYSERSL